MAYNLVITQEARRTRDGIIEYLLNELGSHQAATHFLEAYEAAISIITTTPELHALSKDPLLAQKKLRICPFMNYLMVYRFDTTTITIADLFHASQDYAKLL